MQIENLAGLKSRNKNSTGKLSSKKNKKTIKNTEIFRATKLSICVVQQNVVKLIACALAGLSIN